MHLNTILGCGRWSRGSFFPWKSRKLCIKRPPFFDQKTLFELLLSQLLNTKTPLLQKASISSICCQPIVSAAFAACGVLGTACFKPQKRPVVVKGLSGDYKTTSLLLAAIYYYNYYYLLFILFFYSMKNQFIGILWSKTYFKPNFRFITSQMVTQNEKIIKKMTFQIYRNDKMSFSYSQWQLFKRFHRVQWTVWIFSLHFNLIGSFSHHLRCICKKIRTLT